METSTSGRSKSSARGLMSVSSAVGILGSKMKLNQAENLFITANLIVFHMRWRFFTCGRGIDRQIFQSRPEA
jgi:hypothetical protein